MSTETVTALQPPAWDVVDWTAYWERLSVELDRLATEKAQAEKELAALVKRHKVLTDEVELLTKDAERAGASKFKHSADAREIEVKIFSASTKLAELRQQHADLAEAIELRKAEYDVLLSEAERVRADLDARSADLDRRQATLNERSAGLDAGKTELDSQTAAFNSERSAWNLQFRTERDGLRTREMHLAKEKKELDRDKTIAGCLGKILFPVSLALGALIGGAVVAVLILV